jgi:hypothetical protein
LQKNLSFSLSRLSSESHQTGSCCFLFDCFRNILYCTLSLIFCHHLSLKLHLSFTFCYFSERLTAFLLFQFKFVWLWVLCIRLFCLFSRPILIWAVFCYSILTSPYFIYFLFHYYLRILWILSVTFSEWLYCCFLILSWGCSCWLKCFKDFSCRNLHFCMCFLWIFWLNKRSFLPF